MNVGAIIYDCRSGLGLLARDFYQHRVFSRAIVVPHPSYQRYSDWYPPDALYDVRNLDNFLRGLDILLLFENAFNRWDVVLAAKQQGIKIVMMPMYEYTPMPLPVSADLYICPSLLDYRVYCEKYGDRKCLFIPVPVNKPWKLRERAHTFTHNAGHGGKDYRNGTPELLEAIHFVTADVKLIVRAQPESIQMRELYKSYRSKYASSPKVDFQLQDVSDDELYSEGDVFIFPEKFNGLSLPMQEAFASGMLVMGTHRFPMYEWLPRGPLIRPMGYKEKRLAISFQEAILDPRMIADKIEEYANQPIVFESNLGRHWAEKNSWENLKPLYDLAFQEVLK